MRQAFSVAVFLRHAGRVLLIKHRRLQLWLPVGGEMLPGETPQGAARREALEETGLTCTFVADAAALPGAPAGLLGFEEHAAGDKGMHLNFNFAADTAHSTVAPNHEFTDYRWVDGPDVCECPPNVSVLLRQILQGPAMARHVAQAWLTAFNSRQLDALLALYADDAVHTTPRQVAPLVGKEAMGQWWGDAFNRMPHLHYRFSRTTCEGDRVYLEYVRENPGEPSTEIAEMFELDAAAKICRSQVFVGGAQRL